MDRILLYHNPSCSKSREAKRLLDDAGVAYETRLYLQDPLSVDELHTLCAALEHDDVHALMRQKEAREEGWSHQEGHSARDILAFLAEHPRALQRPIVAKGDRAVIGRPTERVRELL